MARDHQSFQKSANGGEQTQRIPLSPESLGPESLDLSFEGLPTPVLRNGSMRTDFNNSVKSLPLIFVEERSRVTAVAHPRRGPDLWQEKLRRMVDVPVFLCDEETSNMESCHGSSASLSVDDLDHEAGNNQEHKLAFSASNLALDEDELRALRKSKQRQTTEMARKFRTLSERNLGSSSPQLSMRRPSGDVRMHHSSTSTMSVDESSLRSQRKKSERSAKSPADIKTKKVAPDSKKKLSRSKSKPNIGTGERAPSTSSSGGRRILSRASSISSMSTEKMMPKAAKKSSIKEGDLQGPRRNTLLELERTLSSSKFSLSDISNTDLEDAAHYDDKSTRHSGRKVASLPRRGAEKVTKKDPEPVTRTPKEMGREQLARAASLPRLIAERLMRKEVESDKSHMKEVAGAVMRNLERAASLSKSVSERILVKSDSKRKLDTSPSKAPLMPEKATPTKSKSMRRLTSSFSDLKVGNMANISESKKRVSPGSSSRSLNKAKSKRSLERQPSKSSMSQDGKKTEADKEKEGSSSRSRRAAYTLVSSPRVGHDSTEEDDSARSPSRGRTRSSKSKQRTLDDSNFQTPKKKNAEQRSPHSKGSRPPPSKSPPKPRPTPPSRTSSGDSGGSNGLKSSLRAQSPSGKAIDRSRLVAHPCSSPNVSPDNVIGVKQASYLQLNLTDSSSSQDLGLEKYSMSCSTLENGNNEHCMLSTKLSYLELAEPRRRANEMLHTTQHSLAISVSDATLKMGNTNANICCKEESDSYSQSLSVESPFSGGAIAV